MTVNMASTLTMLLVVATTMFGITRAGPLKQFTCPPPGFLPFTCPHTKPKHEPSDVRNLHPSHISAVMAVGDSITAGFAMRDGPLEYRGSVYSTGGDEGALTVGNFIKHYNPLVKGTAKGTTIPLTKDGKGFNFAVSGARVRDVPGQLQRMYEKMSKKEHQHLLDEWKLLTVFIGANDVCTCTRMTADEFQQELEASLDYAQKMFPKTFVNVMTIFNVSMVWDAARDKLYCEAAVPVLHECGCLDSNATQRQMMDDLSIQFNKVSRSVSAKYASMGDSNFTVVVQPAVEHIDISKFPRDIAEDFLSDLDCFHPSECSDQGFAIGLWNNMFAPPGKKSSTLDPTNPPTIYCPSETDVIQ